MPEENETGTTATARRALARCDPTLAFDLTAEEKKEEEEAAPLLSRGASGKFSTRALELRVEEMEGKVEQTLAAVRRVETLLREGAMTKATR